MKRAIAMMGLAVLAVACNGSSGQTNYEFIPEMVDSVPYDSFAPNSVTRDGKTLMTPPKGTIPRGFQPTDYGKGPEEAARAGRELTNPMEPTPANLARGDLLFKRFCTPCHGPGGLGDGPVIPRFPQPPSLVAAHAMAMPEGRIFHVISRGQSLMPSHASQIRPEDRWRIVLFVRSLQAPAQKAAKAPEKGGAQ